MAFDNVPHKKILRETKHKRDIYVKLAEKEAAED